MPTLDLRLVFKYVTSESDARQALLSHSHPHIRDAQLRRYFNQSYIMHGNERAREREGDRLALEFETPGGAMLIRTGLTGGHYAQRCRLPSLEHQYGELKDKLLANESLLCEFGELLRFFAQIAYNYGPSFREGARWQQRTHTHFTLTNIAVHPHVIDVHFNGIIHFKDDIMRLCAHRLRGETASRLLWALLRTDYEATAAIICGVMQYSPHWSPSQQMLREQA